MPEPECPPSGQPPKEIAVDLETVNGLLKYDRADGSLIRISGRYIGKIAGYLDKDGYTELRICGKIVKAHRLIWFIVYGSWPAGEIDHINGIRSDNRVVNLRDVDRKTNSANRVFPQKNNKIGVLGVVKVGNSFIAKKQINGKGIYIGSYDNQYDASQAYKATI